MFRGNSVYVRDSRLISQFVYRSVFHSLICLCCSQGLAHQMMRKLYQPDDVQVPLSLPTAIQGASYRYNLPTIHDDGAPCKLPVEIISAGSDEELVSNLLLRKTLLTSDK